MAKTRIFAAAVAMCLVLSVLVACGGGGATSETAVTNTTVSEGQRLIDLKAALDAGAISQEEYDRRRQQILDE